MAPKMKQDHPAGVRDTLITIQDAAVTARKTVVALLQEGAEGQLELLIELRAGRQLVLRPRLAGLDQEVPGYPSLFRTPDYLALGSEVCKALTIKSTTYFAETSHGYLHTPNRPPGFRRLGTSDAEDELQPVQIGGVDSPPPKPSMYPWGRWKSWALWSDGRVEAIGIGREEILIRLLELYRWLGIEPGPTPDPTHYLRKKPDGQADKNEQNDDFKSDQLLWMGEASLKLWGREGVIPEDPSTHPTNEEVVRWLRATGSFEETPAHNAATLIKPSWGNRAGRTSK